jgi:hypothetical protein
VFDFVYNAVPPRRVLRIKWSLDSEGEVDIRSHDGSPCAVTPKIPMPTKFTKAP